MTGNGCQLLAAVLAGVLVGGCATGMFLADKRARYDKVYGVVGVGLGVDALVGGGAAAIHANADGDPGTGVVDLVPYYVASLVAVDLIVFVVLRERWLQQMIAR